MLSHLDHPATSRLLDRLVSRLLALLVNLLQLLQLYLLDNRQVNPVDSQLKSRPPAHPWLHPRNLHFNRQLNQATSPPCSQQVVLLYVPQHSHLNFHLVVPALLLVENHHLNQLVIRRDNQLVSLPSILAPVLQDSHLLFLVAIRPVALPRSRRANHLENHRDNLLVYRLCNLPASLPGYPRVSRLGHLHASHPVGLVSSHLGGLLNNQAASQV